jgi:uncharacterized protein
MAIEINEKFEIAAPLDAVWRFVMDPAKVVTCMPGAELVDKIDDRNYIGQVKVKLGAISTSYKGNVQFAQVDAGAHSIQLVGEGKEPSGGTAKGTVDIRLSSAQAGKTEMVIEARVDLTGRVMQMGRGMIKGVSHQLFQQFAASAKQRLEAAQAGEVSAPTAPGNEAPLEVGSLLGRTLWAAIVDFFRRLFGRS